MDGTTNVATVRPHHLRIVSTVNTTTITFISLVVVLSFFVVPNVDGCRYVICGMPPQILSKAWVFRMTILTLCCPAGRL